MVRVHSTPIPTRRAEKDQRVRDALLLFLLLLTLGLAGCSSGGEGGEAQPPDSGGPGSGSENLPVGSDASSLRIDTSSYQLVRSERVGRTEFLYTYRVNVVNSGGDASNVRASVMSSAAATVVTDGSVAFGDVAGGSTVTSTDTFTLRQDRTVAFDPGALVWSVQFDAGPADFSLTVEAPNGPGFAGSQLPLRVGIRRIGGFDGEITVALDAPPAGVRASSTFLPEPLTATVLLIGLDGDLVPGSLPLSITASAGGVVKSAPVVLTVAPAQPSAQTLIDEARAAGSIDDGTALLYRAYAYFGDDRLPSAYRGSGSEEEDTNLVLSIYEALPTLDPATQALLRPFTLRPPDPDSWYSRRFPPTPVAAAARRSRSAAQPVEASSTFVFPDSCSESNAGTWISARGTAPFRVWAQCQAGAPASAIKAVALAIRMFDTIWPRMTSDFEEPLSDRPSNAPVTAGDFIGDEAIDIYILFPGSAPVRGGDTITIGADANGSAHPWPIGVANRTSAYLVFPESRVFSEGLQATAIHELFHAMQFGQNTEVIKDVKVGGFGGLPGAPAARNADWWFIEASATWAAGHYDRLLASILPYPRQSADEVFWRFSHFQRRSARESLNDLNLAGSGYPRFIWPYFMEQERGDARAIIQTWLDLGGQGPVGPDGGDRTLNANFSFADNFRTFAVRTFNAQLLPGDPLPRSDRFVDLDDAILGFKRYDGIDPCGRLDPCDVPERAGIEEIALTAGYADDFVVGTTGLGIRWGSFNVDDPRVQKVTFDVTRLTGVAHVDAFVKIQDRDWERRDLDGKGKVVFCYDDPLERLEGIYLVVSDPRFGASARDGVPPIRVEASDQPCVTRWIGTVRGQYTFDLPSGGSTRIDTRANVALAFNSEFSSDSALIFPVESGQYEANVVTRSGGCETTTSFSSPMRTSFEFDPSSFGDPGTATDSLQILPLGDPLQALADPPPPPVYAPPANGVMPFATLTGTRVCPDGSSAVRLPQALPWWGVGLGPLFPYDPNAGQIRDQLSTPIIDPLLGSGQATLDWSFDKVVN
ncbi:hypothetical protein K2X89_02175 [Myxococcota bacterium]|nr:hypothetical protein [Myxococcota bacterium]